MVARVARETVEGATTHNRPSPFWRLVALWLPGLEGLAAGSFLAWNLDVPLITPWQDPLGVLLVIVFVAVIVGLQPRLITAAATAHNQARENRHNQNRRAAEEGYRTRNRHLSAVSTIAAGITGRSVYRSLAALAGRVTVFMSSKLRRTS